MASATLAWGYSVRELPPPRVPFLKLLGCTSCLGERTQRIDSREMELSGKEWWITIWITSRKWECENMAPCTWSHRSFSPGCNCTRSWRISYGLGISRGLFAVSWSFCTCSNYPQCNSVRRATCRSQPYINIFMWSALKWNITSRQQIFLHVPVFSCLDGRAILWHLCYELFT